MADDDHPLYPFQLLHDLRPFTGSAKTWTWTPKAPEPMTRRQTYRYCMEEGWSRKDSILMALLSEGERPLDYEGRRPTFTVEDAASPDPSPGSAPRAS